MIAITTSSSIKVNAKEGCLWVDPDKLPFGSFSWQGNRRQESFTLPGQSSARGCVVKRFLQLFSCLPRTPVHRRLQCNLETARAWDHPSRQRLRLRDCFSEYFPESLRLFALVWAKNMAPNQGISPDTESVTIF